MKRLLLLISAMCIVLSCDKTPLPVPPINQEEPQPDPDPDPEPDPGKPLPEAFTVGAEAFNPSGGHIQGIAATEDALYLSQSSHLCKVDWSGKVLVRKDVVSHTGDICWWNGKLYAAIAINENDDAKTPGKGEIMVFNEKLQMVKEVELDRRVDGIACMDGILYVGMGSRDLPSKDAHRVNILGRFDAATLKEVAPRFEFDYGYETTYGFQDMCSDGNLVYASFYSVGSAPATVAFDKDLKIVKTYAQSFSNGMDFMPGAFTQEKPTIIKATSSVSTSPKAVTCELTYHTLE